MLAILLGIVAGGVRFRLRTRTAEHLDRRQEGLAILILLRLFGFTLWVSTVAWVVWPATLQWAFVPLPGPVRWGGLALGVLCLSWIVWVLRSLGSNLTDTVAIRQNAYLVTKGPYRWIRHPLYTGVIPCGVFLSLLSSTWWFAVMACVVFTMLWLRTATEERNLLARFGEGYRAYVARTGRFLPRFLALR